MEMSFATGDDVMRTVEGVIRQLWSSLMKDPAPEGPFRKVPYQEVMAKYGSDKPDTRYGMEIIRLDHVLPVDLVGKISGLTNPIVEAFKLEGNNNDPAETHKFITEFLDSPAGAPFNNNPDGGPGVFIYNGKQPLCGLQPFGFEAAEQVEELLDPDHGDLIVLQARPRAPFSGGSTPVGDLRRALHAASVSAGFKPAATGFDFLWVVDFPLFSPSVDSEPGQGGAAGFSSTHHPFTAPKTPTDVDLLLTDPTKAVADHYDLVVNGVELGGGSRRIHDAAVQEFIFRDILKMPAERLTDFSHLLDALRSGCPPHAGLALGFDRLVAVMLGKESVRDVIAFPKTGKGGDDAMVGAPSPMTEEALKTYHLQLRT
jgi:Aspartyl-tRNA synthetase